MGSDNEINVMLMVACYNVYMMVKLQKLPHKSTRDIVYCIYIYILSTSTIILSHF